LKTVDIGLTLDIYKNLNLLCNFVRHVNTVCCPWSIKQNILADELSAIEDLKQMDKFALIFSIV